jgi:hypothetical protein
MVDLCFSSRARVNKQAPSHKSMSSLLAKTEGRGLSCVWHSLFSFAPKYKLVLNVGMIYLLIIGSFPKFGGPVHFLFASNVSSKSCLVVVMLLG